MVTTSLTVAVIPSSSALKAILSYYREEVSKFVQRCQMFHQMNFDIVYLLRIADIVDI
jgi:hypothetical protein